MTAHVPARPSWTCVVDGAEWPCHDARQTVLAMHGGQAEPAQRQMLRLMALAMDEMGEHDTPAMYRRFVSWALARGERCRVCQSSRHAVIVGMSPRLVPCNEMHALLAEYAGSAADELVSR